MILDRDAPPAVRFLADLPESEIELDGERFQDTGLGDWIGFYDWLRPQAGEVIGVRLWPDIANDHLAGVRRCVGTESHHDGRELSIFFGQDRAFHPALSGDQDFGGNRLFVGNARYVMTFNAPMTLAEASAPSRAPLHSAGSPSWRETLWRVVFGAALLASILTVAGWTR